MKRILLTVFCVVLFEALAFSNPWDEQHFFIAPVTTDLHRAEITNEDVFAIVDCEVISQDGMDLSPINLGDFSKELRSHAAEGKSLRLIPRYQFPVQHSEEARAKIKSKLIELTKQAGYQVKCSERNTSAKWPDQLRIALSYSQQDNAKETMVETPLVRAYPLNTRLSKLELGDADCVITVIRPIDGRNKDGLPKELAQSIRSAVKKIALPQKELLRFELSSTAAGRDAVEKLFDSRLPPRPPSKPEPFLLDLFNKQMANYKMSPALDLALDMGFNRMLYSHSPQGGSPELRVGQPAPDFEAVDLNGQNIDFTSFRSGRPALLTFWGVACGPCRAEAPHLTRLHEKHRDNFAILAVNDYGESRDKVQEYVAKAKLTHPIVLPKGKVSSNYGVASHPTTFWIDKKGVVRDFVVGFHSSEDLEKRMQKLLK